MWDHTDVCANQYCCKSDIYLISCISLGFCIIIYRSGRESGHGKDVVDGLNTRDKGVRA